MPNLTREQRAERDAQASGKADDRVRRDSAADVRGDRGAEEDPGRDAPMSVSDLERLIEGEFNESVLPNAPPLPGFHLCWMTSNSKYDTIQGRQRLGYVPVRQSEMPGFDASNGQTLERFEGMVTCNEMVLFKIPEANYQAIMKYYHHKKPLLEEEGILNAIKNNQERDSTGKRLGRDEGDGMDDMEVAVQRAQNTNPTFS